MHVVVTANRWAEIRPALLDNLGTRLELRLNDPIDSDRLAPGRLLAARGRRGPRRSRPAGTHVQIALPRVDGSATTDGQAAALAGLLAETAAHWTGPRAEPIRLLPALLDAAELPPPAADGRRRRHRRARGSSRCGSTCSAAIRTSSSSATPRRASPRCCALLASGPRRHDAPEELR